VTGRRSRRGAATLAWVGLLAAAAAFADPPRTLVIALDAVPYSIVAEVTDPARGEAALFRDFHPPVPFLSTFPSSTSVAMVGMLGSVGLARSPGYEARFFDWDSRRVSGGGPISYYKVDFPWRDFFDWSRKGVFRRSVAGLRPAKSSFNRFENAIAAFLASPREVFTVYVESTDTLAHLEGPAELERVLGRLDGDLREARRRSPGRPFRVVLFSDHGIAGGEPLGNVLGDLLDGLSAAGYRKVDKLREPRDVVLTPYGLVSSFEAYCRPEEAADLAALLARVAGVDLCVLAVDSGWKIESDRGLATIERRASAERVEWRYRAETGDPLDYRDLAPAAEWLGDDEWLDRTLEHRYPDGLHRLASAFELVENPASVLCSLRPGFMFGARGTERAARLTKGALEWTHGALYREASVGFLMTDDEGWPSRTAPLRFSEGLVSFLGEPGD
jgi:hypothetical protein